MTDDTARIAELRAENERLRAVVKPLLRYYRNVLRDFLFCDEGRSFRERLREDALYQQARQALKGGKG